MLRGVVDRIEGDVAVVVMSDGNQLLVKCHHLPEAANEGSVLDVYFALNDKAAEEQRQKVQDLQQQLSEKPSGSKSS